MWTTIKKLLSSRKCLAAVGAAVVSVGVLVATWDEAAATELADKIVNVVLILSGLFIGGTAVEDAASKLKK